MISFILSALPHLLPQHRQQAPLFLKRDKINKILVISSKVHIIIGFESAISAIARSGVIFTLLGGNLLHNTFASQDTAIVSGRLYHIEQ